MVDITGFATQWIGNIGTHLSDIPMKDAIIFDIAIILIISAIFAFVAKIFRQPLIPAYVATGLLIGPIFFGFVSNSELISAFAEIGIAFLLFSAGLEISFKRIKEANLKKISIIGTLQVALVFMIALLLSNFLGLDSMQAVYLGIILSFGSTMVVIKILSDKKQLVTLHGRIILGILLLQDLIAIFAIILLTSGGFALTPIIWAITKLIMIIGIALLIKIFILNKIFKFAAKSPELLFLTSLAILFIFIILTYVFELSVVIGAFIAGILLANSKFKLELSGRISPLRDFFSILFFVALGLQIVFNEIIWALFFILLGIGFVIKPFITLLLLRIAGYKPRTSFLSAISLAQLSEFSLIIGTIGVIAGVLTVPIFSTIILATITTMVFTTYFIEYKNKIYNLLSGFINLFKFLPTREIEAYHDKQEKSILLIGAHRMGSILLQELIKNKKELIVLDHNPEMIKYLSHKKIPSIYGDLASPDVLESIDISKLKLVISTVPEFDDSLYLLKKIKKINPKTVVIMTANRISEASELYKLKANYVIVPKIIAGNELKKVLVESKKKISSLRSESKKLIKKVHKILY